MLDVSGIDTEGLCGAAKVVGFSVIYIKLLLDWLEDDTDSQEKIMASIDQMLNHIEPYL